MILTMILTPEDLKTSTTRHFSRKASARDQLSRPDRTVVVMREFLLHTVASVFSVDSTLILLPTRGSVAIARARQVAMYLAHVTCGLSLTQVGVLFERDRTTVAYACNVTEDRREDEDFDRAIELLEQSVRLFTFMRHR